MFSLNNFSLQRGGQWLFKDVNLRVNPSDRIGLLGRNGCGKTSLIKLLIGELDSDNGSLIIPGNTRIASTDQETTASNRTALDYVLDGHTKLRTLQQALSFAESQNNDKLITKALHQLDEIEAYNAPVTAAKLLSGLGFSTKQHQIPVVDFSGGWRMRLNLAKALMCPSDLLLLDEPTNHLDLDAVLWLEDWLKNYPGTLLLISHDAVFLDSVVTHIAHVSDCTIQLYKGNYSDFTKQQAQQLSLQSSMALKQQKQKQHLQSFVDRFRAQATKARQVQSRVKMLEKLGSVALARVASPVQFSFFNNSDSPNPLLTLNNSDMGYDQIVLNQVNISLSPGARIGLLGRNGAGKSTLIKTIGNQLQSLSGELYTAEKLKLGYFSQHQLDTLRSSESPLWHLQQIAKKTREQELKDYLGSFGFSGDRVINPVAPLSGGEKSRLCLALIIWQKPNLLLLDEPTNHLDLDTRNALTSALQEFSGALVLVSHDRALLETSCDEFWLVDSGKVVPFKGDLNDYKRWLFEKKSKDNKTLPKTDNLSNYREQKSRKKEQAQQRQTLAPLNKKIVNIDLEMSQLQKDLSALELSLSDNNIYLSVHKQQLKKTLLQQSDKKNELEALESQWLLLNEEYEQLALSFGEFK